MTKSATCHIVFGPSAAGSVRRALKLAKREEPVLCPFDDFSFGPISDGDAGARAQWVDDVLGRSDWQKVVDETARFLEVARSSDLRPIAWVSFTESRSYAGFLWCLSQMRQSSWRIMKVRNLSSCYAEQLVGLLDFEKVFSENDHARWRARWGDLQSENAPLRIIVDDNLVSVPITHFDACLMASASTEWEPMALIVARVLGSFSETGVYQTGDLVLAGRLADMAKAGTFEWRGDLSQMRGCELRLTS